MRAKGLAAVAAMLLCPAGLAAVVMAHPSPQTSAQSASPPQALKVKTRVITVDVVATDSHGNAVRDLKPEEFEISDSGPQKIAHFAFVDKSATAATNANPAGQPLPRGVYTNRPPLQNTAIPLTVILVDGLNTEQLTLAQDKRHMIALLKTLPPNAPVAVLLLTESLVMVQSFTSNPAILDAALDKALKSTTPVDRMPESDPNIISSALFAENGKEETQVTQSLENFEKNLYNSMTNARVGTTISALRDIARYLAGHPGRKNLIWVSEAFPLRLEPDPNRGTTDMVFAPTADYSGQVRDAFQALADAKVSVYPVYAGGLETQEVYAASDQPSGRRSAPGPSFGQQITREDTNSTASQQATMMEIARGTGGRTCINTNDLSGCIATSLKDSSSYYELAYYPQNVKWDGRFHSISIKTSRPGVTLTYRRGYYAVDQEALAKQLPPEKQLQRACEDLLPATSIPVNARAIPPVKPGEFGYVVTVPADAFDLESGGASRRLSARMAICEYSAKSGEFHFTMRDLTRTISDAAYQELETRGVREFVNIPPQAGTQRVRFVVLDQRTGLTGAVDVPLNPGDWVNPPSAAPEGSSSPPVTSIGFSVASGQSATLDWGGSKLVYEGDLGVDRSAPAFFHDSFMPAFQCESGKLIPRDSSSNATPNLHFTFTNPSGQTAMVDLSGTEPEYSGTLPVDPSASAFFLRLWYLCHCTSP